MLIRKIFYSFTFNNKKDIDKNIKDFYLNYNEDNEESIIKLINKEYEHLIKENDQIIFPYNIFIQPTIDDSKNSDMIFDGKNDYFECLKDFTINKTSDSIDLLADNLKNSRNILVVNIDNKSKFYRKSIGNEIDNCRVVQSNDYCNQDYTQDKTINLDDCLQLYNTEEHLEDGNEWFCKRCKNHVNALKKSEFFYLPKIMIICLSRFK